MINRPSEPFAGVCKLLGLIFKRVTSFPYSPEMWQNSFFLSGHVSQREKWMATREEGENVEQRGMGRDLCEAGVPPAGVMEHR